MMNIQRTYRVGLDIGIGSVGWAVISEKNGIGRIESFGTRIFESGELNGGKERTSQERRGYRGVRRVERRRNFRKKALKSLLERIGFLTKKEIIEINKKSIADIIPLKIKAVKEKISEKELLQCLIHTCNHRGYKDFYEIDEDELDKSDEKGKEGENIEAANNFDKEFKESRCKTVSEYLVKAYTILGTHKIYFRNKSHNTENRIIIRRKHMEEEVKLILEKQSEFYLILTQEIKEKIFEIIFRQRAFEDGPGDVNNPYRRYQGFLNTIGNCRFYPEEKRGFRNTVIGDLYAAINALSQYKYVNKNTGEVGFTKEIAEKLMETILKNGNLNETETKKVLKSLSVEIIGSKDVDNTLKNSFKYLKSIKKLFDKECIDWETVISENHLEYKVENMSLLNRLGHVLSMYQTPSKRKEKIKIIEKLPLGKILNDEVMKMINKKKISGTCNASYRYMVEAIQAFLDGKVYGVFQWEREQKILEKHDSLRLNKIPVSVLKDNSDISNNPVVFRGINETRKIINAIIEAYGVPAYINVEFAKDVAKSFDERKKEHKRQDENEKKNKIIKEKIAGLLGIEIGDVSGKQIERYKLYEEQECKCMYSGKPLGDLEEVLTDKNRMYEVDHIVPFSLILDNTLANKALVYGSENQIKGQRVPLMYLSGDKKEAFIDRVQAFYTRNKPNPISEKKREYLLMENIYGEKMQEKLSEWKSRNINDTRYITKFMIALLKKTLIMENGETPKIYGIRGHITSRFRKHWLNRDTWGSEEKARENYLNHAADAVIIACLTQDDVRISMEYEKLRQIYIHNKGKNNDNYREALFRATKNLKRFSKKSQEEIFEILTDKDFSTCIVENLRSEVDLRFGTPEGISMSDEEYENKVSEYYNGVEDFIIKPYMPHVSRKINKRFRGKISDSNPVRLVKEDGELIKISRKSIKEIKYGDIEKIRTNDKSLIEALKNALEGKAKSYTVKKYMEENGIKVFKTTCGQEVHKVSVYVKKESNYYVKEIDDKNYSILGKSTYYCIEVYEDEKGKTKILGLRYVDMVKRNGKLYLKEGVLPKEYVKHVAYLFNGEYLVALKKDKKIFEGNYQAVEAITQNRLKGFSGNLSKVLDSKGNLVDCKFSVASNCIIEKYHIDLLGRKCGKIDETREGFPCFVPLSYRTKKN